MNKQDKPYTNEIRESRRVKGAKTIRAANWIYVSAETTGLRGGDGRGARTIIELADSMSTNVTFRVPPDQKELRIELAGDSELLTMAEALEYVVTTLKQGIAETQ